MKAKILITCWQQTCTVMKEMIWMPHDKKAVRYFCSLFSELRLRKCNYYQPVCGEELCSLISSNMNYQWRNVTVYVYRTSCQYCFYDCASFCCLCSAGVTIPGGKLMNSSSWFGKTSVLHVFTPHFSHTEVCATCARSNCGLLSQSRVTQIEEQPRDTSNNTWHLCSFHQLSSNILLFPHSSSPHAATHFMFFFYNVTVCS